MSDDATEGWKEATIAWTVCASIHREYAKGKDPFFTTRQGDYTKHENDARKKLLTNPKLLHRCIGAPRTGMRRQGVMTEARRYPVHLRIS